MNPFFLSIIAVNGWAFGAGILFLCWVICKVTETKRLGYLCLVWLAVLIGCWIQNGINDAADEWDRSSASEDQISRDNKENDNTWREMADDKTFQRHHPDLFPTPIPAVPPFSEPLPEEFKTWSKADKAAYIHQRYLREQYYLQTHHLQ